MALALFTLTANGSGSAGTEAWRDLGLIPSGYDFWIGIVVYTSVTKAFTFQLRSNLATKSTGTLANTSLLATAAPKVGVSVTQDLYRSGRLHTATVKSTGVEHWWMRVYSKSGTSGSYLYKVSYCQE